MCTLSYHTQLKPSNSAHKGGHMQTTEAHSDDAPTHICAEGGVDRLDADAGVLGLSISLRWACASPPRGGVASVRLGGLRRLARRSADPIVDLHAHHSRRRTHGDV